MAVAASATEMPGRGVVRLGGAGKVCADLLSKQVEAEIRVTVLGHLQRGGSPTAADRLLSVGASPRSNHPKVEHAAMTQVARILLNLGETQWKE